MNVREKLVKICFREFCDLAGDSPCGCDGCPYGEYEPDNGGCYVEYKKDKIEKLENDMDKYQKEDNGVTVQEWISVDDRLPEDESDVLAYSRIGEESRIYPACYYNGVWFDCVFNAPATDTTTHWMPIPNPPKGE